MQNDERAKMFLPFDALNVYESIKDIETKFKNNGFVEQLKNLKIGRQVFIKYYDEFVCKEIYGLLKNVDIKRKIIYVQDSKISFDEIIIIKPIQK